MGASLSQALNCSAVDIAQSDDDINIVGKKERKIPRPIPMAKPRRARSHPTYDLPPLGGRGRRRTRSFHPCEYSDFVDVVVMISSNSTISSARYHSTVYVAALNTISFITQTIAVAPTNHDCAEDENDLLEMDLATAVKIETMYARQLAELAELGLTNLVPTPILYSLLQTNKGNMDMVLHWFQMRELFEMQKDSMSSLHSRNSSIYSNSSLPDIPETFIGFEEEDRLPFIPPHMRRLQTPLEMDNDKEDLYAFLAGIGLERYFEALVRNGYDCIVNLQYAEKDDLVVLDMKLGHARRVIQAVRRLGVVQP